MIKELKKYLSKNKRFNLFIIFLLLLFCVAGCSLTEGQNTQIGDLLSKIGITQSDSLNPVSIEQNVTAVLTLESTPETTDELNVAETPVPTPTSYEIQIWIPPQFDPDKETKAGNALSEVISSYLEENPNVDISIRVKATNGESSMINTIIAADHVAKKVLPSLALMSRGDLETSVQRGILKPIETEVFSNSNSWYNFAGQSAVVDSVVYGIPVLGDGLVLTYRNSKINPELGDWQDIISRKMPIGFVPSASNSQFGTFMYLSMGGKLTNDQGQIYLDQQKLTDSLNFFLNGVQNGSFPSSLTQLVDLTQVWQRFTDGTMSMIITPFSSFRNNINSDISVHSLPLQPGFSEYPLINTWNLVMLEDDPVVQPEVIKFAEYLCDTTVNDKLSVSAGYLPVRNSEHEYWKDDPQYDVVNMMSQNGVLVPNVSIANKIYPVINNALSQVIKTQLSPEDAAKDAVTAIN